MNKQAIKDLCRKLEDRINTGCGEAYHSYIHDLAKALLDEEPAVDRTLRGWVMVEQKKRRLVRWACDSGLHEKEGGLGPWYGWEAVEKYGWTVRPLTPSDIGFRIRRWDEWADEERREWYDKKTASNFADRAIDIATRQDR